MYREWGGAQIYFLAIMKLAKPDWNIKVFLPRESLPEITRNLDAIGIEYEFLDCLQSNDGAPTISLKARRQWQRLRAQMTFYKRLKKLDLRNNILHIELAPWQDWAMIALLVARGANVFSTMHNFPPRSSTIREAIWKARFRFVSKLSRFHIFASNHDTKNRLKGWVDDRFWDRIRVTTTAVDPAQIDAALSAPFDREAILKQHSIEPDDFVVLCVGQFVDRKGRWVFLDAARTVTERDPSIKFVWLTPQLPSGDDQRKIDDYSLGDKLRIVKSDTIGKERIDVLKFFRIADVFALPSYVEGLPIALMEAMALGIPSISTNVYAIPEAVKHMETGLLIEAGDAAALAESILKLKNDSALRSTLSAAGRAHVLEHFDERDAAAIAIEAYREALNSN
jgi:glycosyltransferase involved in cell wall biosynthesis